ncbi:MAG: HEPN domain-containing protein [Candidatus Electrothrix sp. AUS4]|nr:HEPN domain-containing protein [Candidatus Electrothrix sp. AUS4]
MRCFAVQKGGGERGCRAVNYKEEIIRYRLERAEKNYQEALLMQREKHWNTCANRLYYACFYAVSALLQQHDFSSGKHRAMFLKRGISTIYVTFPSKPANNTVLPSRAACLLRGISYQIPHPRAVYFRWCLECSGVVQR